MARGPRLEVPGLPCHVVQRGNDRRPCFNVEDDYRYYLLALSRALEEHGCRLHAYVLMTNHVHLLLTPGAPGAIALTMQDLGRRYVRQFNNTHGRSGTLWEGRYKSSLIDTDHYLLACQRYIELNPVRAGIVVDAADYRWSSIRSNLFGSFDAIVTPHETYLALGADGPGRRRAYGALLAREAPARELSIFRQHIKGQRPVGSDAFRLRFGDPSTAKEARDSQPT